ncbi:MAG: amino acid ABC transporter permease [Clostridiaceae bacterium]|jgi:His/Glu/Gln/Arg/opine family amino acid ABC transporter permease subunit|nr:amino acid ABC transporter permease [Clostridiaceae bacterium]
MKRLSAGNQAGGRVIRRPQKQSNAGFFLTLLLLTVIFVLLAAFQDQLGLNIRLLQILRTNFINDFIVDNRWTWLVSGLGKTLVITILAAFLGVVIGLILAMIRVLAHNGRRIFFLARFADIYVTVIRGTPVLVQLLIIYFVIFASVNIDKTLVAALAFGINSGAYVAEIVRAGVLAVDQGQMEAGRSLGLTYGITMRKIILPQAVKNVLPAMFNELITLLKETSVAGYIAVIDLTRAGDLIRSRTFDAVLPLLAVALIYLLIVTGLTVLMNMLERRLRRSDNR